MDLPGNTQLIIGQSAGNFSKKKSQPETRNQKPETRNQKPETRNQKPETRNQKPETRNQKEILTNICSSSLHKGVIKG